MVEPDRKPDPQRLQRGRYGHAGGTRTLRAGSQLQTPSGVRSPPHQDARHEGEDGEVAGRTQLAHGNRPQEVSHIRLTSTCGSFSPSSPPLGEQKGRNAMKTIVEVARRLAWEARRDEIAAGRRVRSKTWGKKSRDPRKERRESRRELSRM